MEKTIKSKIWDYPIRKPVASMSHRGRIFINIREEILLKAKRAGAKLRVWGSVIVDPTVWLLKADRREQVFLRPDQPMVLRGYYVEEGLERQRLF